MERFEPSPTRESDFDHEFATSCFDYFIDQYQQGKITYAEAIDAYTSVMLDITRQDNVAQENS